MSNPEMQLSIVVPVKDEQENIEPLLSQLSSALLPLNRSYEIIYVDDGSTDHTYEILTQLKARYPQLRVIKFDRNYGQTAAMDAGSRLARGSIIITIDGDLQNDPADIPRLLENLADVDMVCGFRAKRQDNWSKRLQSRIANYIRNFVTGDDIIDTGCTLKAFRAQCLKDIKLYTGMHRFLPTLFKLEGYRVKQLPVNHRPRFKGQTKYNMFNRMFRATSDLFAVRWMQARHLKYKIEKES